MKPREFRYMQLFESVETRCKNLHTYHPAVGLFNFEAGSSPLLQPSPIIMGSYSDTVNLLEHLRSKSQIDCDCQDTQGQLLTPAHQLPFGRLGTDILGAIQQSLQS